MRRPRICLLPAFVSALPLTGALVAQATHLVGPGGFATINAALAVAAPGDVLLLQPGSYPGYQATIGVTLRAVTAGTVTVASSTVQCPAPQSMHLLDITQEALFVSNSVCTLDACQVTPLTTGGASLSASNSRMHIRGCTVGTPGAPYTGFGSPSGLFAAGSVVSATDSVFRGRDRDSSFGAPGGPAIDLFGGTFHGSNLTAQGGSGLSNTASVPGNAVRASAASVWISDSTLLGGTATDLGVPWQCPVVATVGGLARCTLTPSNCAPAIPVAEPLVGAHCPASPAAGAPLQLELRVEPNGFVGVFASLGLQSLQLPELVQPAALDLATLFPLAVLVADGSGLATGSWLLPPGTSDRQLWLQAVTPGSPPLQLGPLVGGVVR